MANTKITELSAVTALAGTDVFPVVDVSASTTNKVSVEDLLRNAPDGSAGAPSMANAGDQDTGILFPADNSVGVSTGGTQRLVIDGSGRVGIGDTAPSEKLNVAGNVMLEGGDQYLYLTNTGTGNSGIYVRGNTSGSYLRSHSTGIFTWEVTGSEKMRIDSSGRVGIGETNPVSKLIIKNTSSNDGIRIISGTSGEGFLLFGDTADNNTGGIVYSHASDALEFNVNNFERLRLDSSGRLLLGTTTEGISGADNFTIAGSSNAGITIRSGTSSNGNIYFSDATSGNAEYAGYVQYSHSANNLTFGTASTARVTVDSSGRLLVGTSSSSSLGIAQFVGNSAASTNNGIIEIKKGAAASSSGVDIGHIRFSDTQGEFARIFVEADGTTGSSDYPGRLVFSTTADGASSPTERVRITSTGQMRLAGAGITFNGDSAQANELDDYEEGTFDAFATVAGSFTGESTKTSRYTRIGNMVYCDLRVEWTGTTGSTGLAFDLPFAQAGTTGSATGHTGIVFYSGTSVDASAISTHIAKDSSQVSFYRTDGGSFSAVTLNNVNGTYEWIVSFSYFAA